MCGIIGVFSQPYSIEESKLKNAINSLFHRGPDSSNVWISPNKAVALAHTRLSIIDLETGSQPISNEDEQIHIVVNGEFYGFEAIRANLESLGHKFRTKTDSEVPLHLYEEYGVGCLEHLRGEFAFILWDEKTHTLFAARDRFGIKPLCYSKTNKGFYIASEAKALFALGLEAKWDYFSYFHSASLQYLPQDRTVFSNINQLPPGHYLLVQDNKNVQVKRYWDLDYPKENVFFQKDEDTLIDELKAQLNEAVSLRLRSDVPICCYLSGGLDSSIILALATKYTSQPIECFSVSFSEQSYDEFALAQEMAKHVGAKFNPVFVSQQDLISNLSDAVYYSEGLAINGHLSAKFVLSKAVHQAGFKVVLTGEGSDEFFAGYPHLRQDLFLLENKTAEDIAKLMANNSSLAGIQLAHGQGLPLNSVKNKLGYIPSFLQAKATFGFRIKSVLSESFKQTFENYDCYKIFLENIDIESQLTGRHIVNQSSYLWSKLSLANYILHTLGDGTEMAHSVEGRLPFLDHKLFEFAKMLPMNLKIRGKVEKYILREAAKPLITKAIYHREKYPFTAPPISCFSNPEINIFLQDTLRSKEFACIPFFDQRKVINLLEQFPSMSQADKTAIDTVIFTLLTTLFLQRRFNL